MSREDLTAGMVSEATAASLRPRLLAKLEFDSGDVRVWSGVGDLSFGGETYTGVGDLGGVSAVEEKTATNATGLVYTLSGVPSALVSIALREHYQDRPATLWFGALDASGALIADPYQAHAGRMDQMTLEEGGETATIRLSCESHLIDLERPRERRYTPEDQQDEYANDTLFVNVAGLQDAQVPWGRAA